MDAIMIVAAAMLAAPVGVVAWVWLEERRKRRDE
jgi:ABC-type phosphate transport system permease subunit